MAKRDFSKALRKTATAQRDIIDDRFSRADSVLLGMKRDAGGPGEGAVPPDVTADVAVPHEATPPPVAGATKGEASVIRDTFSMPPGDHGLIETLRTRAAREGRNTSKSEVVRAGLLALVDLSAAQLVEVLDRLERVKPGRK
jgi:hypothetical protein